MKESLEEISIHEVNRIGGNLNEDLKVLQENLKPKDKEIVKYVGLYVSMIKSHNKYVKETNSYLLDHIVKYYRDKKTGELSYTKDKKRVVGF